MRRRAVLCGVLSTAVVVVAAASALVPTATGADRIDSGWAVSTPPSKLGSSHGPDPKLRIAINHVLEQGRVPLLQVPASSPDDAIDAAEGESSEVSDGWRPAGIRSDATLKDVATDRTISQHPLTVEFDQREPQGSNAARASSGGDTGPRLPNMSNVVDEGPRPLTSAPAAEAAPAAETRSATSEAEAAASPRSDRRETTARDAGSSPADTAEASAIDEAFEPPATESPLPLTSQLRALRTRVRRVLKSYYTRPLNSRDNDPWEVMHGMLAYGLESRIRQGSPNGKTITAVGWLCYNKPCKGMTLLYATKQGDLRAKYGVGLQGHMGQFLAMLAQCRVSPDYPIRVGQREYTIHDLIEAEKVTCYSKSELTFKLIALMHYLDSDAEWVNDQGVSWSIPKLIHEELSQPIRGAACGGTHRLAGLSLAARTRVRRGEPLDGEFLRAAQFVEKYHKYAFQMQNSDGSLSTQWFRGRGSDPDIDRRVKTTGHILEWLCYSLSDEELHSPPTIRAVSYLTNLLASNYRHEWEVGPMCHAIHALKLYDERVFQPHDADEVVSGPARRQTAKRSPTTASRSKSR